MTAVRENPGFFDSCRRLKRRSFSKVCMYGVLVDSKGAYTCVTNQPSRQAVRFPRETICEERFVLSNFATRCPPSNRGSVGTLGTPAVPYSNKRVPNEVVRTWPSKTMARLERRQFVFPLV